MSLSLQCEDVIRKLEAELVSERQQVAQTAGQLRGRDKQITTLRNGLEALQGDQEKATAQLRKVSVIQHGAGLVPSCPVLSLVLLLCRR